MANGNRWLDRLSFESTFGFAYLPGARKGVDKFRVARCSDLAKHSTRTNVRHRRLRRACILQPLTAEKHNHWTIFRQDSLDDVLSSACSACRTLDSRSYNSAGTANHVDPPDLLTSRDYRKMQSLSPLGTFLTLSFLLPGMIIFSTIVLLFPETHSLVDNRTTFEIIAAVLVISFLNGHPVFICERYLLEPIWDHLFPAYRLSARSSLLARRSVIIASAESLSVVHLHLDHIFGEYILFTNTSFWIAVVSLFRLFDHPAMSTVIMAVPLVLISIICLVFTSPFFKFQYLNILETLEERIALLRKDDSNNKIVKSDTGVAQKASEGEIKFEAGEHPTAKEPLDGLGSAL